MTSMLIKTNIYRFYFFISVFCGFYIFGFFPAPYYVFLCIGLFFISVSKIKHVDLNVIIIMCCVITYMIVLLSYSKINVWSYYFIGLLTFFAIIALRDNLSVIQKKMVTRKTISFSTLLVLIDTIYRFKFPRAEYLSAIEEQGKLDYIFYGYKHSFLFQDSNFVGLFILSVYFLFRENTYLYKNKKLMMLIIITLIIFTFSRAALVALIFTEVLRFLCRIKVDNRIKAVLSLLMIVPLVHAIVDVINHISDASFESKFMLLYKFWGTIEQRELIELTFGWGLDNTRDHWGIAAHSLFNTMIIEMGLVGFILIILSMLYCWSLNKKTCYHFIGLSIAFLSFGLIFTPFFIPLGLNIIMRDDLNETL